MRYYAAAFVLFCLLQACSGANTPSFMKNFKSESDIHEYYANEREDCQHSYEQCKEGHGISSIVNSGASAMSSLVDSFGGSGSTSSTVAGTAADSADNYDKQHSTQEGCRHDYNACMSDAKHGESKDLKAFRSARQKAASTDDGDD